MGQASPNDKVDAHDAAQSPKTQLRAKVPCVSHQTFVVENGRSTIVFVIYMFIDVHAAETSINSSTVDSVIRLTNFPQTDLDEAFASEVLAYFCKWCGREGKGNKHIAIARPR